MLHCCDKNQKHLLGWGMPGGTGRLNSCPGQLIVLSSIHWSCSWSSIQIILLSSGLLEAWKDWACKNWMFKKRRVFFLHLSGWLIWFIAEGIIISDWISCWYFVEIVWVLFLIIHVFLCSFCCLCLSQGTDRLNWIILWVVRLKLLCHLTSSSYIVSDLHNGK